MRRQAGKSNPLGYVLSSSYACLLDLSGSIFPDLLVDGNSDLYVVSEAVLIGENDAECSSVFDGLTGPLGLMGLFAMEYKSAIRGTNGWV